MSRAGQEQSGRERQDQALHGDWNLVHENSAAREGKAGAAVPLRQSALALLRVDDNIRRCVTFLLYTDHPNRVHATDTASALCQPVLDRVEEQGLVHDRLRDVVVEARAEVLLAIARHGVRGQRDHR